MYFTINTLMRFTILVFFMVSLSLPYVLLGSPTGLLNEKTSLFLKEAHSQNDQFNANYGHVPAARENDTLICLPLDINLGIREYQGNTSDTTFICVYDTVSIVTGYAGPLKLLYKWSNGSSDQELTVFTTGVGTDIQKIWLDITDPQSGCVYSDTLTIIYQYGSCVGIKAYEEAGSFRIFPNPAHDFVLVESDSDIGLGQLAVINVNGQVVYEESLRNGLGSNNQIRLDLRSLPRGFYLVRLISEKGLYTGKILLD